MNIFIVGVGMGDTKYLTKIAEEKIYSALGTSGRKY